MTITYFSETDTLLEFDAEGRLCAITLEHARERGGALSFALEESG